MPRNANSPLALFGEPVFNEDGNPTPDPTTFKTPHDPNRESSYITRCKVSSPKTPLVSVPRAEIPATSLALRVLSARKGPPMSRPSKTRGRSSFGPLGIPARLSLRTRAQLPALHPPIDFWGKEFQRAFYYRWRRRIQCETARLFARGCDAACACSWHASQLS